MSYFSLRLSLPLAPSHQPQHPLPQPHPRPLRPPPPNLHHQPPPPPTQNPPLPLPLLISAVITVFRSFRYCSSNPSVCGVCAKTVCDSDSRARCPCWPSTRELSLCLRWPSLLYNMCMLCYVCCVCARGHDTVSRYEGFQRYFFCLIQQACACTTPH
jgi:hypothetical protein